MSARNESVPIRNRSILKIPVPLMDLLLRELQASSEQSCIVLRVIIIVWQNP